MIRRLGGAPRRTVLQALYGLLYGPGSVAYELVAGLVSLGEWSSWRRSVLPHVTGPVVLEIGFGTGRLIPDLVAGRTYLGLDPSPWMHRRARRFLAGQAAADGHLARGRSEVLSLLRGRAEALPLAGRSIDTIVSTFPTPFILDARAHGEFRRVLKPSGRLIVVAEAGLRLAGPAAALTNRALGRGGSPPRPSLADRLRDAGFRVTEIAHQHPRGTSYLVLARSADAG